ncbi:MAG: diguanylate cyclase [Anaerolineales bacterium]|nr:diguanylate cyclase [Anaerolineales bacterium]
MNEKYSIQAEINILASLGRDLAATTDAETAAKIILDAADNLMGWDACYLILYDPKKGGVPRPLLTIDTVNKERIFQRDAAPQKPSENMLKAIEQGGFLSQYEEFFEVEPSNSFGDRSQRTLSQLFVPVVSGSRTIGILSIQSYQKYYYDNKQLVLLNDLASHCAGALERIWAQEALEDFVERLKILHSAVNAINASLEMERVCQVVYETVIKVMPCNDFVIDGYDSSSNEIVPIYAIENPDKRVYTNRYVADHGMAGEIVRTRMPLLFTSQREMAESTIKFELYGSTDIDPTESVLAVPMILHGEIYGMVSAQSFEMNAYDRDDLYLLEVLASHAAIAIENARLFDSIQHLANTDPLTGILNRRRFFELAELEFSKAENSTQPFSVIMLDIDDFKKFNDEYGHKVGDAVLILAAKTCKTSLRGDDVFGRMGGEEFIVALPNTRIDDAYEIAIRLKQAIHELDYSQYKDPVMLKGVPAITVSVGVSEYNRSCKTLDILIDRADQAMYRAKNSGRNRAYKWGSK